VGFFGGVVGAVVVTNHHFFHQSFGNVVEDPGDGLFLVVSWNDDENAGIGHRLEIAGEAGEAAKMRKMRQWAYKAFL
jgi:hypothetical protein